MRLISDPAAWAGEMPAVLAAPATDGAERRVLLRVLASRVLGRAMNDVRILHPGGRGPSLAEPRDGGLHLSAASRSGLAVVAVGRTRIGVDVEAVEPGTEPPWNVLHPDERAWLLRRTPGGERERCFARLWAAKEAYLKALGLGFRREPSSFAVLEAANGELALIDPEQDSVATISTDSLTQSDRSFAIALVELPRIT